MSEFLKFNKYWLLLILFIVITIVIWWFGGQFLWIHFGGAGVNGEDAANLRGDSYGMINTLFSGFAFVGIIISIMMQSEELKLQRQELKATRDEFEEQSKVFRMDLFEKSFYNLLDELGKSITNFQIKESHLIENNEEKSRNSDRKILTGRTGLGELLARGVNENCDVRVSNVENKMHQVALKYFLKMKYNPSEEIRIYLRTLDLIVTIIDKKVVDVYDREFYSSILKCGLSRIERDMIDLYIEGISKVELLRCYKEVF